MNHKDIDDEEYTSTLITTAVITILAMLAIFAGGAYAIMAIFHLHWFFGVALFVLFVFLWSRKPKK